MAGAGAYTGGLASRMMREDRSAERSYAASTLNGYDTMPGVMPPGDADGRAWPQRDAVYTDHAFAHAIPDLNRALSQITIKNSMLNAKFRFRFCAFNNDIF